MIENQKVHWTELQGNPYSKKPSLFMWVLPDGETITVKGLLKQQIRDKNLSQFYDVVYDKQYVIEYFKKKFFEPLGVDYDTMTQILQECLNECYEELNLNEDLTRPPNNSIPSYHEITEERDRLLKQKKSAKETVNKLIDFIYSSDRTIRSQT